MKTQNILLSVLLCLSAVSQAELFDRGGGMIYDDVLDITWLQDAQHAGASTNWADAVTWAAALEYGGFDDWRLPSMDLNGDDIIVECSAAPEPDCRDNELGYMFYQNLAGNLFDILTGDQGPFLNIAPLHHSSTEHATEPDLIYAFRFFHGLNFPGDRTIVGPVPWAVRDGDSGIADTDGDGVADLTDNCTTVANADQRDSNNDGHGNRCDFDYTNDCVTNFLDLAPFGAAFGSVTGDPAFDDDTDLDGNGVINFLDLGAPPDNFAAFFRQPPGPSASVCTPAP